MVRCPPTKRWICSCGPLVPSNGPLTYRRIASESQRVVAAWLLYRRDRRIALALAPWPQCTHDCARHAAYPGFLPGIQCWEARAILWRMLRNRSLNELFRHRIGNSEAWRTASCFAGLLLLASSTWPPIRLASVLPGLRPA
jgi:hypothetical protein